MAVIDNLVAYWALDEASGTRNDAHGTNHLTEVNTVTSGAGKVGTAALFTGSNFEALTVADNADLSMTGDMSFSLWFKTTESDIAGLIVKDDRSSQREYSIYLLFGSTVFFQVFSSAASSVSANGNGGVTPNDGGWHHLVATYTSSDTTPRFSVDDGSQVSGSALGIPVNDTTAPFEMGAFQADGNFYLSGNIDEVGVWKKALTGTERTWLYNAGAGRSYADIVAEAGGGATGKPAGYYARQRGA